MVSEALFSSACSEWETPPEFFEKLSERFDFQVDVAASHSNHLCDRYFTAEPIGCCRDLQRNPFCGACNGTETGLTGDWASFGWAWCNPPYGRDELACRPDCKKKKCPKRGFCITEDTLGISHWTAKAALEQTKGNRSVLLLPARTDTKWFHRDIYKRPGVEIEFIEGRLEFRLSGEPQNTAPFPSMLAIFDRY